MIKWLLIITLRHCLEMLWHFKSCHVLGLYIAATVEVCSNSALKIFDKSSLKNNHLQTELQD